ncbi:M24 family metallopeptidase [Leptospira interrogans]
MSSEQSQSTVIPFDFKKLDALMDRAGLDVILATSKHNVQYLLGGHRAQFFSVMDAVGISRYVPVLIYVKGEQDKSAYIGHRFETADTQVRPLWVAEVITRSSGSVDAMQLTADYLRRIGKERARIGLEMAFLPTDSADELRGSLTGAQMIDATTVLERLRAVKTPEELSLMRKATEYVADAMQAVIKTTGPGTTKSQIVDKLRLEESNRGLNFEYCLIAAGTSFNRAPSDQRWELGDVLSIDSGGNYGGYLGDIARMAILGEPDQELLDILGAIEAVQRAAIGRIAAGTIGNELFVAAKAELAKSSIRDTTDFMAHGVGLVTHEAPRLTTKGPVPYDDPDAFRPLEAGMVLSVETTTRHPTRGFIKLEDTIAVLADGHEVFASDGRGWNQGKWH